MRKGGVDASKSHVAPSDMHFHRRAFIDLEAKRIVLAAIAYYRMRFNDRVRRRRQSLSH